MMHREIVKKMEGQVLRVDNIAFQFEKNLQVLKHYDEVLCNKASKLSLMEHQAAVDKRFVQFIKLAKDSEALVNEAKNCL